MDLAATLDRPALTRTRWSVEVRDGDGVVRTAHEPARLLRSASVGKVFLLVEVAARVASGVLDPGAVVRRDRGRSVADSGLWQHLDVAGLSVADAARLVGAVSDNRATNVLLDLVGLQAVQQRARSLAPRGSTLHDLVRDDRGPTDPPTLSEGCAADWVAVCADLAAGRVVDPRTSRTVVDWLSLGTDLSMVASAFELDPLAHLGPDRGVTLWNKTGTDSSVRADVGRVDGPGGSATYAVLCAWDRGEDHRTAVMAAMREIGAGIARLVGAPWPSPRRRPPPAC